MGYLRVIILLVLVSGVGILCSPTSTAAPKGSTWKMGRPIVWYFAGPGYFNYVNDLTVSQLVAGGWNLGWAYSRDELDVYYRHGVRALAAIENLNMADPAQIKLLEEKLKWSDHPATYGYWICDEPKPDKFENIGKLVAYLRKHDSSKPAVVNLLPLLGVADGDAARAYRADLKNFVDTVKPDVLCYDAYPFMAAGDGIYYFLNLMLMREASLKYNIPFWYITQAIAHENLGYRWPTEHEMRWLAYTTLAYGGQGLSWYIYNDRLDIPIISGFFEDAPDSRIPNSIYWAVSRINRDFEAIAAQVQPLESIAAYHSGPNKKNGGPDDPRWKTHKLDITKGEGAYWARHVEPHPPYGGTELPADSQFKLDKKQDLLLGCFGKRGKITHVLVVNLDYKNPITTTLSASNKLEIFHSPTQTWTGKPLSTKCTVDLPAGGGILLRLRNK